jgi:hypothetical protein
MSAGARAATSIGVAIGVGSFVFGLAVDVGVGVGIGGVNGGVNGGVADVSGSTLGSARVRGGTIIKAVIGTCRSCTPQPRRQHEA